MLAMKDKRPIWIKMLKDEDACFIAFLILVVMVILAAVL